MLKTLLMSHFMKNYSDLIMNSLHSPFNIHILNITNSISSLDNSFIETLKGNKIFINYDNYNSKKWEYYLKDIKLCDKLLNSNIFQEISKTIENLLEDILCSEGLAKFPADLKAMILSFKEVMSSFFYTEDGINPTLELLEQSLDNLEQDTVKSIFYRIIGNEKEAEILWDILIDLSASMYGLLASIPSNSKWEDIIRDKTILTETIQTLVEE